MTIDEFLDRHPDFRPDERMNPQRTVSIISDTDGSRLAQLTIPEGYPVHAFNVEYGPRAFGYPVGGFSGARSAV